MGLYEIITCIIYGLTAAASFIAVFFTYKNLREIRKQFFEQTRGSVILYFAKCDNPPRVGFKDIILKNFGNSYAIILDLKIDPPLDWGKTFVQMDSCSFDNIHDLFLAPGEFIRGNFDFSVYPNQTFDVRIKYKTAGALINDSYPISLDYIDKVLTITKSKT